MEKQKIKIDIVSDINCPWCFLGESRLQKAMDEAGDHYEFEVAFKPFELSPDAPQQGEPKKEYFARNYGKDALARMDASSNQLAEMGRAEGVAFNFDKSNVIHNTFNGHRLIWLAGEYDVQVAVAKALFEANFTRGENVNDPELLKEIGIANGIPAERLEGFFSSEEGIQEVKQLEYWAKQSGVTGVPAFVFNDQYLVTGAQPASTLKEFFGRVAPAPKMEKMQGSGDSCGVDGNC